jgi:hypothetical protein
MARLRPPANEFAGDVVLRCHDRDGEGRGVMDALISTIVVRRAEIRVCGQGSCANKIGHLVEVCEGLRAGRDHGRHGGHGRGEVVLREIHMGDEWDL